jgi:hypothetical protein
VALREAQNNGYIPTANSGLVLQVLDSDRIQVDIEQPAASYFTSFFVGGGLSTKVMAIAEKENDSVPCILALDDSAPEALLLKSNSVVTMGCGVHSNSSDPSALVTDSNAQINADSICTVGGYVQGSNSTTSVPVEENCSKLNDPYAGLAPPPVGPCDYNNMVVDSQTLTLQPGVYCGGLEIKNNSVITFAPGTYIMKDGPFVTDSNTVATGAGVTFYFTGNGAVLNLKSNTTVNFSAPTAGDLAGVLFFQDPAFGGLHKIDSNVSGDGLDGLMYFPSGDWESNSNSTIGGAGSCVQLVARRIKFDSNAGIVATPDFENCPNYAGYSVNAGSVSLVQ